jgi:hypothetical protein
MTQLSGEFMSFKNMVADDLICILFCSNSMNGWPAKQGRSQGARHGLLKRRIMGSALKPSFWLLSRKGNVNLGPDIICHLALFKMRQQSLLTICMNQWLNAG